MSKRKAPKAPPSLFSNQLVEDLGAASFNGDYYLYKDVFEGYTLLILRMALQLVTSESDKQNIRKYFGFDLEEKRNAGFKKYDIEVGQREFGFDAVPQELQRETSGLVDNGSGSVRNIEGHIHTTRYQG